MHSRGMKKNMRPREDPPSLPSAHHHSPALTPVRPPPLSDVRARDRAMRATTTDLVEARRRESSKVMQKYPDRLPVVCTRRDSCTSVPQIDKTKYLVPMDMTVGQFIAVLRKRLVLAPAQAIFLLTESGQLPSTGDEVRTLHAAHRSADGFLYLRYAGENTFGGATSPSRRRAVVAFTAEAVRWPAASARARTHS